jgi:NADPH:quinone reductase-like Zn-dependent oxidoreductase
VKAAVLHALGEVPRFEEVARPVPAEGEELIEVTAAPLNQIDKVRAAGSHYSAQGPDAAGGLPAVPGVIGAGRRPGGQRVLFGSRLGTMAQYSVASPQMAYPIPDGVDDAVAAAVWNPGLSAWLALSWRAELQPGETVLVLGATGVTGQLAVQIARRLDAGRIVAAGRNREALGRLPGLGADAVIQLGQPDGELADDFRGQAGERGYGVVLDYLWGHPTEVLLDAVARHDLRTRSARLRLVQTGEMAGPRISLPAAVLRSAGLEILGSGTGTMPPLDVIMSTLAELLGAIGSGELSIDIQRVPLSDVSRVWPTDQRGCRPVFVP